ncbi:MAG TPA: deoxyguanosinetriphosphate triphosphohydrolase [Gammaproteobacteria bacterium]|nr:deoxyguanosinetriphosphate triphosphohydrolase [Gammaproteobacteria bacterium]HBX26029.1 deoxyguanosinetriphosphate triphosphohydrolase [Gammaproteobacteria bacterium]
MMDWNTLLSTVRMERDHVWVPQQPEDERSQWQRDHDRLIFSGAFRRLAVKTQVHSLSDNDHVHTRLSHSLEVASVGRSLGVRLGRWMQEQGLLSDQGSGLGIGALVQTACLAHDIGNPPFGHAGEGAIRQFFESKPEYLEGLTRAERSDLLGFEGNAQGFRVITCLERHWFDGGMRLTAATLGTFLKYPFTADSVFGQTECKHGINQAELPFMRELASHLGLVEKMPDAWARHPLVYAVEAADDICYALIDLEDAVELGHLDYEEVSSIMKELVDRGARRNLYEQLLDDSEAKLELLRSAAIDALVNEAQIRFQSHYDEILNGVFEEDLLDWRRASAGEVIERAKSLARERIYVDLTKQGDEDRCDRLLGGVLSHLIDGAEALSSSVGGGANVSSKAHDALIRLGKFRPQPEDSKYQRLMRVTDYVSAMTDRYLIRLADDLARLNYLDIDL